MQQGVNVVKELLRAAKASGPAQGLKEQDKGVVTCTWCGR